MDFQPKTLQEVIADAVTFWRDIAARAGVNFRCLEAEYDPDQDAPVSVEDGEDGEVVVRIDGVISQYWGVDVNRIIAQLDEKEPSAIRLLINSPGGSYWDGLALYNDLRRRMEDGVTVKAEGLALVASAATLPFMAADERIVREGCTVMIHQAWSFLMVAGNADELEDWTKKACAGLRSADKGLVSIYSNRTGRSVADMKKAIADETWMTGSECVDCKFATQYIESEANDDSDDEAENRAFADQLANEVLTRNIRSAMRGA